MSTLCICIDLSLVYGAYSICMQWVPIEASAMDLGRPLIAPKCIFWQREQHCYNGFKVFMKLYLNFNEIFFLLFMFGCGYRDVHVLLYVNFVSYFGMLSWYSGMKIYHDFSQFLNCSCEFFLGKFKTLKRLGDFIKKIPQQFVLLFLTQQEEKSK